jgi:hypothetical protein
MPSSMRSMHLPSLIVVLLVVCSSYAAGEGLSSGSSSSSNSSSSHSSSSSSSSKEPTASASAADSSIINKSRSRNINNRDDPYIPGYAHGCKGPSKCKPIVTQLQATTW